MIIKVTPTEEELARIRRERYLKAADKLRQWSQEDPAYDERVGEILERELMDSAMRCEDRDEPSA